MGDLQTAWLTIIATWVGGRPQEITARAEVLRRILNTVNHSVREKYTQYRERIVRLWTFMTLVHHR